MGWANCGSLDLWWRPNRSFCGAGDRFRGNKMCDIFTFYTQVTFAWEYCRPYYSKKCPPFRRVTCCLLGNTFTVFLWIKASQEYNVGFSEMFYILLPQAGWKVNKSSLPCTLEWICSTLPCPCPKLFEPMASADFMLSFIRRRNGWHHIVTKEQFGPDRRACRIQYGTTECMKNQCVSCIYVQ